MTKINFVLICKIMHDPFVFRDRGNDSRNNRSFLLLCAFDVLREDADNRLAPSVRLLSPVIALETALLDVRLVTRDAVKFHLLKLPDSLW